MPRLGTNLSRSPPHKLSTLRTLVSHLIEHQQIRTTFVKAKLTARETERVITWAKKNTITTTRKAQGYIRPWLRLRSRLFDTLASRYAAREGGYTRIHRIGHRAHDHAPLAVVELVDSPHDISRALTCRIVGRELAEAELLRSVPAPTDVWRPNKVSEENARELLLGSGSGSIGAALAPMTRQNLAKTLSPIYAAAFPFCQPEDKLDDSRIRRENLERKRSGADKRQRPPALATTAPVGQPSPTGAYTTFLYQLRVHFHRNLAALKAENKGLVAEAGKKWVPTAKTMKQRKWQVAERRQGRGDPTKGAETPRLSMDDGFKEAADAENNAIRAKPRHLKALNLPSLKEARVEI